MWQEFASDLELIVGDAHPAAARVYARWNPGEAMHGLRLSGTLEGPSCPYSQTLPASVSFVDCGPGTGLLAQAVLPDPCFWSPELPYLYRVQVSLCRGTEVLASTERFIGLRTLGRQGHKLRFESKPYVLRAVETTSLSSIDLHELHEADTTLVLSEPIREDRCRQASEIGVLVVQKLVCPVESIPARLKQLAKFASVGMVILPADADPQAYQRYAPNLLLGAMRGPTEEISTSARQAVANIDFLIADWTLLVDAERSVLNHLGIPLIARRALPLPARTVSEARRGCDHLQRDLAGRGDFVGYVV